MMLVMALDVAAVSRWFDEYFDTYAACTRGERDMAELLSHYGVPMVLTTDEGVVTLMTDDEAAAVMQSQTEGLRAQGYHRTDVLHSEVTVLNSASALYRASLSRRRADGGDVDSPTITYLVSDDVAGLRIVLLAVHAR
jgi:hypothetical protein